MPLRKWDLRIRDIVASIERIMEYTRNLDFDNFKSDTKTVDAVVRNFEIIGEAAAHMPEEILLARSFSSSIIISGKRREMVQSEGLSLEKVTRLAAFQSMNSVESALVQKSLSSVSERCLGSFFITPRIFFALCGSYLTI